MNDNTYKENELNSVDYRPLSAIELPALGAFTPDGLVVVVGPNSAGKTQFLQDLHHVLIGARRELVVCEKINLSMPPRLDTLLESLVSQGYFRRDLNENGHEVIRQVIPHFGLGQMRGGNIQAQQVKDIYDRFVLNRQIVRTTEQSPFMEFFGQALSTVLFLDRRLALANQVSNFDYDQKPPENDLQALHYSVDAQEKLTDEILATFSKGIWLDFTRGNVLCFRVKQSASIPIDADRLKPFEMKKYRKIESEGDGLRSYVGICLALLLGRRPVCLIDEPEMCLHPPQAYAIGKFIGRNATSLSHSTFVATHSSHVLRGIVDAAATVRILRLTRIGETFHAHLIDRDMLKDCLEAPTIRAETVLDGIFTDGVAVVESDGDRVVYEAAWAQIASEFNRDISFVPVGGTGGFGGAVNLFKTLRIPIAVIADLDLVMDRDKLKTILRSLTNQENRDWILGEAVKVRAAIRAIPPTIDPMSLKDELREIVDGPADWQKHDDGMIGKKLNSIAKRLSRTQPLKKGGVSSFTTQTEIASLLQQIIHKCKCIGLFLVPVGELEHWANELMNDGPGRSRKAEWANEASIRIRREPERAQDIISFVKSVAEFHRAQLLQLQEDIASK